MDFSQCVWKPCPDVIGKERKYFVDPDNPRLVTNMSVEVTAVSDHTCTAIGTVPLPLNSIVSWDIKPHKPTNLNCTLIYVGVAPLDIDQGKNNLSKCGWYYDCETAKLYAGPPHKYKYKGKDYPGGQPLQTDEIITVVMNTSTGELSYRVKGVDCGVAFTGIPIDKPLAPCALIGFEGDSVELMSTNVRSVAVDPSIPAPAGLTATSASWDTATLVWGTVDGASVYQIEVNGSDYVKTAPRNSFTLAGLPPETVCTCRVRAVKGGALGGWSNTVSVRSQRPSAFPEWSWKACPDSVEGGKRYLVDENNSRVVSKIGSEYSTILVNAPLPLNAISTWNIKVLSSRDNESYDIYVGVAPADINLDRKNNYKRCGWYLNCHSSTLFSGPPHNYFSRGYGVNIYHGQYIQTDDTLGVIMDTTAGELTFVEAGVNFGRAFKGIPLDKPLVPCVILGNKGDSVELIPAEVRENLSPAIPAPSDIRVKCTAWDTITLRWDKEASDEFDSDNDFYYEDMESEKCEPYYQIEVDGNKSWHVAKSGRFTIKGVYGETEHTFKIRTVKSDCVSEWSSTVKATTPKAPDFLACEWKECPETLLKVGYTIPQELPVLVTKTGNGWATIIGNTHIYPNKTTSWNVKLQEINDNGGHIFVGVAPSDIDLTSTDNHVRCGWYYDCFNSLLHSGPPHNYKYKLYGPRANSCEEYVYPGDCVGAMMEANGDLTFFINSSSLGVAFRGIPLDKPLVPCVIIRDEHETIQLDTTGVNENKSIRLLKPPSNVAVKEVSWDSITLAWSPVKGAQYYKIETDGGDLLDENREPTYTKVGLLPDSEHSFRVIAKYGEFLESEWSEVVKGKTEKGSEFKKCVWKQCPKDVDDTRRYIIDPKNPRIASKDPYINYSKREYFCTIIGTVPIPLNNVASWKVKVLKSKWLNCIRIYIGVAPNDVCPNVDNPEYNGWYFGCHKSVLRSGPPHNYKKRPFGPRNVIKEVTGYANKGAVIGVTMDTVKARISFTLNGNSLGVGYEKVPLDKPLVPCAIMKHANDSVELIID